MAPGIDDIIAVICEIREDLAEEHITADSRVQGDLGLDSLDLIQLARLLRKRYGLELQIESWPWRTAVLGSIVDHLHEV